MLVPIPSSQKSGKLREVTDLQTRLVDILVAAAENDGTTLTQAAVDAGYQGGREAARVSATKALQTEHVQAYLQKRLQSLLKYGAVGATQTLVWLSTEAKSEYVRMNAAATILDRSGHAKPDRSLHIDAGELIVNIDLS